MMKMKTLARKATGKTSRRQYAAGAVILVVGMLASPTGRDGIREACEAAPDDAVISCGGEDDAGIAGAVAETGPSVPPTTGSPVGGDAAS